MPRKTSTFPAIWKSCSQGPHTKLGKRSLQSLWSEVNISQSWSGQRNRAPHFRAALRPSLLGAGRFGPHSLATRHTWVLQQELSRLQSKEATQVWTLVSLCDVHKTCHYKFVPLFWHVALWHIKEICVLLERPQSPPLLALAAPSSNKQAVLRSLLHNAEGRGTEEGMRRRRGNGGAPKYFHMDGGQSFEFHCVIS